MESQEIAHLQEEECFPLNVSVLKDKDSITGFENQVRSANNPTAPEQNTDLNRGWQTFKNKYFHVVRKPITRVKNQYAKLRLNQKGPLQHWMDYFRLQPTTTFNIDLSEIKNSQRRNAES